MPKNPKHPTSDQPTRSAKLKTNLVALGSAAVFSVYAAGFERTQAAAQRFANESDDRLPPRASAHTGVIHAPSRVPARAPVVASTSHESAPSTTSAPKVAAEARATTADDSPKHERAAHQSVDSTKSTVAAPSTVVAATPAPVVAPAPSPTPSSAPTPVAATASAPAAPAPTTAKSDSANQSAPDTGAVRYKDGTYTGWGTSRHGDIQATVMVKSGRITFAGISECLTQYSCSWISALPPQVVERQSAEVDYVSGATQSTRAFYYAVLEALAKAK